MAFSSDANNKSPCVVLAQCNGLIPKRSLATNILFWGLS